MATLYSKATGSLTAATATWGVVDATSYLNAENATESLLTTAYSGTRSSAFTPGAIEIDGIAVKLCERIGTTGTMSVNLELDSDNSQVAGTEVTINVDDLPSALEADINGGWIFFKFAAPVTLLGATAYQVAAKTSSATMVDLWCDGTADNLSRCLRTTTEAAPAAGDDLIVGGQYTAADTMTAVVVTMDCIATTDFGSAPTAANSLITPGLSVCAGGTVTYGTTAATNYYLKMSNSVVVYSGGTLNIGTVATPIPRDSTAVLEFDPAADGDYGLIARNLSTLVIQGLSRTSGKDIVSCKLNTDEAIDQTTLGVDTDTGWLDNDQIVVASTTRTAGQSELGTLNGAAGASSLTVDGFAGAGGGLAAAHSGTSPTQAEVILLTRNIKIRSATSTLMFYINPRPTSTMDIDWAEFYYMGTSTVGKRGIDLTTTTGSFDMKYCSIHDTEAFGFATQASSGNGFTVQYNVFYNLNTAAGASTNGILIVTTSNTTWVFSNNIIITVNEPSAVHAVVVDDVGGTFQNNTIVSATISSTGSALVIGEATNIAITGTYSDILIHSCAGDGFKSDGSSQPLYGGIISNLTIWRCNGKGINFDTSGVASNYVTINGGSLFGNATANIELGTTNNTLGPMVFKNMSINSDASFTTGTGVTFGGGGCLNLTFIDCTFGTVTAHTTQDIGTGQKGPIYLINTTLGSTTEFTQSFHPGLGIYSQKHDQSSTTFKTFFREGTIASDTTVRHTASGYSWKLTPLMATQKLLLPGPTNTSGFKAAVNASTAVTITAYVYKDATYNGNNPRLVLVGGLIGGIAADVTDTLSVAHSNWEQLSVSGTPNEAGVVEYYIDCDGTAGNVYVDDISVTQ